VLLLLLGALFPNATATDAAAATTVQVCFRAKLDRVGTTVVVPRAKLLTQSITINDQEIIQEKSETCKQRKKEKKVLFQDE
jgi:hypothetical protein